MHPAGLSPTIERTVLTKTFARAEFLLLVISTTRSSTS